MKSRGYRKIPGDICTRGNVDFEPYEFTCCNASATYIIGGGSSGSTPAIAGLSVALTLAILVAVSLGVALAVTVL